jgi:hypothetical protein
LARLRKPAPLGWVDLQCVEINKNMKKYLLKIYSHTTYDKPGKELS